MPFGTKYEYNPIPTRIAMLLSAYQNTGKTTFASRMLPPGKAGLVVDADQRFNEVVSPELEFYPLSDTPHHMIEPEKIYEIMSREMPKPNNIGLAVIDSLTNIITKIILQIQSDVEKGQSSGARGYKKKADAMKWLNAAFLPWNIDVIWIFHTRDYGDASGKAKVGKSVTKLELERLWQNINIECEIIVDEKTQKRGLKVIYARGGRSGFTIWDDSGSWEGIRERLLQEVWGGLTKEEQTVLLEKKDGSFSSSVEAVAWAVEQGAFNDVEENGRVSKAQNSMKKLYKELKDELGDEFSQEVLYAAWVDKVQEKLQKPDSE